LFLSEFLCALSLFLSLFLSVSLSVCLCLLNKWQQTSVYLGTTHFKPYTAKLDFRLFLERKYNNSVLSVLYISFCWNNNYLISIYECNDKAM
jgi:hypothetical protein